jgi:hypothetical protein
MFNLIQSSEHAFAIAIGDLKKTGRFITATVLPLLVKVHAAAPTIEEVSAAVDPNLVNIERIGDAVLGKVIQLITDGNTAAVDGLTAALGIQIVTDAKAIAPAVVAAAKSSGVLAAAPAVTLAA